MQLIEVSLTDGKILLKFSPDNSFISLKPFGSNNTYRLLNEFMEIQESGVDFDYAALCSDNISFRTRNGVKRVSFKYPEPGLSNLCPTISETVSHRAKHYDGHHCRIFLDTAAPDADLAKSTQLPPTHPEMTLTNPNHIQTYSTQPLQVEAFQYWYPLTNSQRLWLGNYFIEQPPRRAGDQGAILIHESLTSESTLPIYVLSGSYIILYPSGRLRVLSKEKFQEEFRTPRIPPRTPNHV
jgi:hypothetical protein